MCEHRNGTMIPQVDLDGKYIKSEYMICNECRLVTITPTQYSGGNSL